MYIPAFRNDDSDPMITSSSWEIWDPKNISSFVSKWLPGWVDTKDPDYKKFKKSLSYKWSTISFLTTLFIMCALPISNYIFEKYLFALFNRVINRVKLPTFSRNNFIVVNIGVIKTIIFWTLVTGVLSFTETYQDLLIITKRLGRVPTTCLPTILFLTLRPSPLPKTLYLSLLPIHKWLSRIVVLQSLLHSILYIVYFQHQNTMAKIYKLANIHGIILMLAFLIITITSLPFVRRINYGIFYLNHYLLTWVVVICLYFHARPGIPYITLLNISILLYQLYYRLSITKKTKLNVIEISQGLSLILIPNTALSLKDGTPGCHIRVSELYADSKLKDIWSRFFLPLQHPYTLTTLPSDNVQKLIVRNSAFKFDKSKKYYVTGAFLPFLHFIRPRYKKNSRSLLFKVKCKRCLIIVGGSLISFALPIMRVLNYNGCSVKIIWVVRDLQDLKVLNYYSSSIINEDSLDVYITGDYSEETKNAFINSISEYDLKRNQRNLEEQEIILNGNNVETVVNDKTPLLSRPQDNPTSYSTTGTKEPKKEQKRRSSSSSLAHKISMAETLFTRDEDDLENVDVELNDCDYEIHPSRSNHSSSSSIGVPIHDVSAGFDDELDLSFPSDFENSEISNLHNNNNNYNPVNASNTNINYSSLIKLNLEIDVRFGRPKLGGSYYNWCIDQTCIGPVLDLSSGESMCCKDVPQLIGVSDKRNSRNNNNRSMAELLTNFKKANGHSIGDDDSDALYLNSHFIHNKKKNKGQINDDVWVIGAGPSGLVNNAQLWANDCGFHFHAESFSV